MPSSGCVSATRFTIPPPAPLPAAASHRRGLAGARSRLYNMIPLTRRERQLRAPSPVEFNFVPTALPDDRFDGCQNNEAGRRLSAAHSMHAPGFGKPGRRQQRNVQRGLFEGDIRDLICGSRAGVAGAELGRTRGLRPRLRPPCCGQGNHRRSRSGADPTRLTPRHASARPPVRNGLNGTFARKRRSHDTRHRWARRSMTEKAARRTAKVLARAWA